MKGLTDEETSKRERIYSLKKFGFFTSILTLIVIAMCGSIESVANELKIKSKVDKLLNTPEISALRPSNFGTSSNSAQKIYFDKEFREKAVSRFSGSIQIETESYDDNPNPKDDMGRWVRFLKFHDYLKETYPLIHKHLKLDKPNQVGLLYTWEGSNPDLKPLLLTAHQDVVPVDPLTLEKWSYPPYSGYSDGETIWGRGSADCKDLLVAIMEAVEALLQDGYEPERSIVLAFGCDEESGGKYGAKYIGQFLLDKYGPDSFYALVDEGTSLLYIDDEWYAVPATTEKGQVEITIQLTTPGGHSSVPPDHTSIGMASKLITLIEDNPFKPILSSKNPYLRQLQEVAKHSKKLSDELRRDILRAEFDMESNKKAIEYVVQSRPNRYMIQSTQAIDVIHGGVKSNALPEFVEILFDSRVSVDQTADEVVDHILGYVKQVAKEFDLGITVNDKTLTESTKNGYFNVTYSGRNTLPVSPDHGEAWDVFTGTIKHVWEDIVFSGTNEKVHIAPSLLTPNTDTKHYLSLTPNVYRFFPMRLPNLFDLGVHSVDERIGIDQYLEGIAFMYEFILNVNKNK